jgi:cobalt/nickel transport system permease protein
MFDTSRRLSRKREPSWLFGTDPRVRIVAAVAFSVLAAVAGRPGALGLALGAAMAAAVLARCSLPVLLRRLVPLNVFMLVVLVTVPLTASGEPLCRLGPLEVSRHGLWLAAAIALKANAIFLMLLALVGTMDPIAVGHALHHLKLPDKLIHLLLFCVRYIEVVGQEYRRLRWGMRVRGFCPRLSAHTLRSFGYLVGMLLVRSVDRSERILAAMKCRGFRGRFFLLDHFALRRRDAWLALAGTLVLALLALAEWS